MLAFLPQSISIAKLYPHLLSYYSANVGGLRGAKRLGMETTYWCESYADAIPYLNEHAKPGDMIWVDPLSQNVMVYYQVNGKLRGTVEVDKDISEKDAIKLAKENKNVKKFLEGKKIKKEIFVKGKLVSFVV